MIDKIIQVSDNELTVIFDNRSPITITSDNGSALHLAEYLLSPRYDMTYSEYLGITAMIGENTDIVELEELVA